MSYKYIDMDNYVRKAHFDYFKNVAYPYIGTTVEIDIKPLMDYTREHRYSFYFMFLHIVALAADGVPELRQRIAGDNIIEYDECPTSHVELADNMSYCYCKLNHHMSIKDYLKQVDVVNDDYRNHKIKEEDKNSVYFIYSMPWLQYSSFISPVGGGDDSNPRITWGNWKLTADGKMMVPVTILAHHALVDGIHIARFYDNLNVEIEKLKKMMKS